MGFIGTLNGLGSVFITQIFNYSNLLLEIAQYIWYISSYTRDGKCSPNYFCSVCTMCSLSIMIINKACLQREKDLLCHLSKYMLKEIFENLLWGSKFFSGLPLQPLPCPATCEFIVRFAGDTWKVPQPASVQDGQVTLILCGPQQEWPRAETSGLEFHDDSK